MHNAQCTMHNARCTMHNARCTMRNQPLFVLVLVVFSLCGAVLAHFQPSVPGSGRTLTVLFDNYPFQAGCAPGWGFSALLEGAGRTILVDAGADETVFRQ